MKTVILGLGMVLVGLTNAVGQNDTVTTKIDTLSLVMKSINSLIKINEENHKKEVILMNNIKYSGMYLNEAKESFVTSLAITGLGLAGRYFFLKENQALIEEGYDVSKFSMKLPTRFLIGCSAVSFGFTVNSFLRIGKAGRSLQDVDLLYNQEHLD